MLTHKIKQFFFWLIKLGLVIVAFYFIYRKLTDNPNLTLKDLFNFLHVKKFLSFENVIFMFFLTSINWFLEIKKWQILVAPITPIRFRTAYQQCLGSLTASLFTPNRIGEYGAKAMYYTLNHRKHILRITLIGNVLQMTTTTLFGLIGLWAFTTTYPVNINYYKLVPFIITFIILIILLIFLIKYSKFSIRGFSFEKMKRSFLEFPITNMRIAFFLSLARYIVFSFQFFVILRFFGTEISYFNAMTAILTMYFLASIVPSVFIFDVVIKGSVALFLFGFTGINEITVLSTITLMWLLNFVLPGILGSYQVIRFNLPQNTH